MKLSTLYTSVPEYIEVADVPAGGAAAAPQTVAENTLTVLNLNTEVQDTASIATLNSNTVTIPAGTYYYEALAGCGRTNSGNDPHPILGLWNDTASKWEGRSENYQGVQLGHQSALATVSGQFVVTASTNLQLKILVRTEVQMRINGSTQNHTNTTAGVSQRQTLKLWKLK